MWTVFVAIVFFGVVIWVMRENKEEIDKAARIPFEEADEVLTENETTEQNHG